MKTPTRSTHDVVEAASAILGAVEAAEHVPAGFSNENWKVTTGDGCAFLVKFGPSYLEQKWRAAQVAHDLAARAGIPVASLVHFGSNGDELIRIFEWVDGVEATTAMPWAAQHRFFEDLADVLVALRSIAVERFGSRIDGSGPLFERWDDYLDFRLQQVRRRCLETRAIEPALLDEVSATIIELARQVAGAAKPVLCHRDLYAGNLLVRPDGQLLALLDFDMAETWDAAGEWFKLNRMLLPSLDAAAVVGFEAACVNAGLLTPAWEERMLVVDLIESLNLIANAIVAGWDPAFEVRARGWLAQSLKVARRYS